MTNKKTPAELAADYAKALSEASVTFNKAMKEVRQAVQEAQRSPEWTKAVADLKELSEAIKVLKVPEHEPVLIDDTVPDWPKPVGPEKRADNEAILKERLRHFRSATAGWNVGGEQLLSYFMEVVVGQHLRFTKLDLGDLTLPGMIQQSGLTTPTPGFVRLSQSGVYIYHFAGSHTDFMTYRPWGTDTLDTLKVGQHREFIVDVDNLETLIPKRSTGFNGGWLRA